MAGEVSFKTYKCLRKELKFIVLSAQGMADNVGAVYFGHYHEAGIIGMWRLRQREV